jgi:phosphoglycerate dehydrogenase-like enzyme
MRYALWDLAAQQKDRLRPLLDPADELVEVPEAPASPVAIDVLVASRFTLTDATRVSFRLLQMPGAGTDKIAIAAVDPSAWICNAYEHEVPIAEYVFAAMLDHTLGYGALTRRIAELGWGAAYFSRPPHGELAGKTVGLIGLGHIGAEVARRANAFEMKVMAVTSSGQTQIRGVDWVGTADRFDRLLSEANFVVVACPLTETTRGMLGADQFRTMKRSALLINVARAEIAVEEDLYQALKQGLIAGAVIDAWYQYPASATDKVAPSRFPFGDLPNVRMTPHSSAWTDGVWERRCRFIADNMRRLVTGAPLMNIVRAANSTARRAAL